MLDKKYIICFGIILLFAISGCTTTITEEEQITDFSLLDIKEKGKLVVGMDIPYGVMEFFDESGNAVGIDIDIAKEITSKIGVELEIKTMPFDDLFGAVKNEEVDVVISATTITLERQEEMLFSIPYFDTGLVVVIGIDNKDINVPDGLKDKKVGVLKGTTGEDFALEYLDPSLVTSHITNEERKQALLNRETDAIVIDYIAAIGLVKKYSSLKIVGEPLNQEFYGIITKLGNKALIDEINKILRELKMSGKLKEINDRWV